VIKKDIILISIFSLITSILIAQNLIPNSGFEQFNNLPTEAGEWCAAKYWDNINGYCDYDTTYGSPDYLHLDGDYPVSLPISGFSYILPYEGNAIMGLYLWSEAFDTISSREYISTPIATPLETGEDYTISFYISNGLTDIRYGGYGVSNFGIYFSETKPQQEFVNPILVTPQIELNEPLYSNDWFLLSFSFTADKEYQYMTLGNFKYNTDIIIEQFESYANTATAYYYIDEVCLIKQGDDCSISTSLIPNTTKEQSITIHPNPVSTSNIHIDAPNEMLQNSVISIHDVSGKMVFHKNITCANQPCQLSVIHLPSGVYLLTIQNDKGKWSQKFIRQ